MKKFYSLKSVLLGAAMTFGSVTAFAQGTFGSSIFAEDFGTLADNTSLTNANTNFSYTRVGTSTGTGNNKIVAKNPSSFTESSAIIAAKGGSISTIDKTGLTSFNKGAFTFNLKTPTSLATGVLFSGIGTGASFGSVNGFTSAQLTAAFQINGSKLQVRAGNSWTDVATLATTTNYEISLLFNNSGNSIAYGAGENIANGKVHVYVDGIKKGEYNVSNNLAASAFRIYTTSSEYEIDDIAVYDNLPAEEVACEEPVIVSQPIDAAVTAPASATFTVEATGDELTYEWQGFDVGGNVWISLADFDVSATTATFNIPVTYIEMNGAKFRVVISSGTCITISNEVTLTVSPTLAVGNANATKANLVKNTVVSNTIIFAAKADVQIVNMNGQVVKTASVNENTSLDVASLVKGTYIVTGNVNGKMVSQKIIKK